MFSCGNSTRLITMMVLVALYFLVELIVGHLVHSLALIADAFHMLSDLVALFVGLAANRISKWPRSHKNTYGWQRAEVMGGLINTVVLITLCFSLFVDALGRFIHPKAIDDPRQLFFVGLGGLLVNILGLFILGSHSHGGSHTSHVVIEAALDGSVQDAIPSLQRNEKANDFIAANPPTITGVSRQSMIPISAVVPLSGENGQPSGVIHNHTSSRLVEEPLANKVSANRKRHASMNMRAVFLHVLADFFGSVIVVFSASLLWFVPNNSGNWKLYIDPSMSVIMIIIIVCNAVPLARKATLILLQYVPSEISIKELSYRLENLDGVHSVHDLHVWPLKSDCIIGTVHVRCVNLPDYLQVLQRVKAIFHEFDIHCTTIQPEFGEGIDAIDRTRREHTFSLKSRTQPLECFVTNIPTVAHPLHQQVQDEQLGSNGVDSQTCFVDCGPNKNCQSDTCCPIALSNGGLSDNGTPPSVNIVGGNTSSQQLPRPPSRSSSTTGDADWSDGVIGGGHGTSNV